MTQTKPQGTASLVGRWKPYSAYKDSGVEWLGPIPEHWEVKRLKYLAPASTVKLAEKPDSLPYIGLEHIESKTGHLLLDTPIENVESTVGLFEKENVLFGKLRPYLAKVLYVDFRGVCTTELLVLQPSVDVEGKFLFYSLLSDDFITLVNSLTYGTKMPRASSEQIGNLSITLPSFGEQRTIATFLDRETTKINNLIAKKERLIELLQEKRTALISHVITKGLDPTVAVKDSGVKWLGEIPAHWEVISFRRICRLQQGLQIAQSERFAEPSSNRLEYLTIKSIHAGNLSQGKEYIENPPYSVICKPDDVLLARTGATGEVITGQLGVFHNNFFKVDYDRQNVYKTYLIYYLLSPQVKHYLLLMAGTNTIPDLNHDEFLDTSFTIPGIEEQQAIAAYLDQETAKIDALISRIHEAIEKLKEYSTSLTSAAVTGKIDVREEIASQDIQA